MQIRSDVASLTPGSARSHGLRPLVQIDGWPVTAATPETAVASVMASARDAEPAALFTLNLDHLVKLRRQAEFRSAYEKATAVTADGQPIVWLARASGVRLERTTGADLIVPLAAAAAAAGHAIYLFGTSPAVLGRAGRRLAEATDHRVSIAGSASPPAGFDPLSAEADAALDRIAASGARICLVALGAPKQEIFAARGLERGLPVTFVCIGAGLDFLAGAVVRAPEAWQRHGLEWLWRLIGDPGRLAARYARCALLLGDLVVTKPLRRRLARLLAAG